MLSSSYFWIGVVVGAVGLWGYGKWRASRAS